eukprot:2104490-Rhodomonas_salina.2
MLWYCEVGYCCSGGGYCGTGILWYWGRRLWYGCRILWFCDIVVLASDTVVLASDFLVLRLGAVVQGPFHDMAAESFLASQYNLYRGRVDCSAHWADGARVEAVSRVADRTQRGECVGCICQPECKRSAALLTGEDARPQRMEQ